MTKPRPSSPAYPIRTVSRITGLSTDVLRAWERRYRAVTPARGTRGRAYGDADIARLKRLSELVSQGHAIGTIAALSDERLAKLLQGGSRRGADDAGPAAPLRALTKPLEDYDVAGLETALNRHAAVLPPRELVFLVILPLLRELGRRWQAGTIRPSQEHLVSAIVRTVVGGLLRTIARPDASPRIVFATLPGERHEIGLLCAALLAASAGYGVIYLGADLPGEDVAHVAATADAPVVVVSVTVPTAATRPAVRQLARRLDRVELWVGGPAAATAMAAAGHRTRHVESLEHVVEMLGRHTH